MSSNDRSSVFQFLAPRYWPTLLGLALLRVLVLLPYRVLNWLGWALGGILMRVLGRRHVVEINLQLCFPELDDEARDRLVREHFTSLATSAFDLGLALWAGDRRVERLVKVEGLENLLPHVEAGRGIILLSGHFPAVELTGRALARFVPDMAGVYRPQKNRLVDRVIRRARQKAAPRLISRFDIRQMLRLLRQGGIPIWYASDQGFRGKGAELVPFFGEPAMTNTALSQLARVGDTVVIPYLPRRLPGGQGLSLTLLPALDDFPTDDPGADALRVHHILEEHIRGAPAQYYWIHRRFKYRPPELGEPY